MAQAAAQVRKSPISYGLAALALVGCLAFIVAKNISSHGQVVLGQFQYWVFGAAPFIVLTVYASMVQRSLDAESGTGFSRRIAYYFVSAWVAALVGFIFLHES